jgi:hypothetical protein
MRKLASLAALALIFCVNVAFARDAIDGHRVVIKPYKDGSFAAGEFRFGKAELFGYVGDLKDSKKITGMLLRDSAKATDEQKHVIAEIAKAQQLDAIVEVDGKEQPLVDPKAAADAAAAGASSAAQ